MNYLINRKFMLYDYNNYIGVILNDCFTFSLSDYSLFICMFIIRFKMYNQDYFFLIIIL